jgi:hypothetical protein
MLRIVTLIIASLVLGCPGPTAFAQFDTTFTYQGRLIQGGEPVTGTVNLSFRLYNAAAGGSQVAPEIDKLGFGDFSEGGEFTVQLDFGSGPFNGSERWLEVRVNGASLSPRQQITGTPYSIHTRGIHVNDSQWVGIGTMSPLHPLHVSGPTDNSLPTIYADHPQSDSNVPAIRGRNTNTNNRGIGVDGRASYIGLLGIGLPSDDGPQSGTRYGVYAQAAVAGVSNYGILAHTFGTGGTNYGVYGAASDTNAYANYGVYGFGGAGATHYWAGYFSGKVNVTGTLSKGGGSFRIDHPLDPENKYLHHSFVESPDMMNIYNGNIVTDSHGYATIEMPDWFDALNRDFRYQLTVIDESDDDAFVQVKVVRPMRGRQFTIRTSEPWTEVSWQVTGIRQDAWAEANRIPVEELKPAEDRGLYLHPEAFGLPRELGVDWKHSIEAIEEGRANAQENAR